MLGMDNTVHKHTTLLVAIVPQVNTCQVTPPAIMRDQIVKYVSAADILIKMAQSSCKWCSAGKYIADHMSTQSEHNSADDCDKCGKGKYRAQTHDTACSICQRSRYTDQTGRGDCTWCSAGKYITDHESTQSEHDDSNDCDKCPNGRYRTQQYDSSGCNACPTGKYLSGNYASQHASSSNCKICQRSKYTDQTGRGDCTWCSAGKYIADHESTQSEHNSADDCDKCGKGKYRAQTHDTACSICQRSRYTDQTGRGDCTWCSAGKYITDHASTQSEHDHSNDCDKCPNGRYRTQQYVDSSGCNACPTGKYLSGNYASQHASSYQTVKYVNVVNTQIKLGRGLYMVVVQENTSLTMRVPKVNMMILMTVINAPMEGTVHNNTILLVVALVLQVNTCQVTTPASMRAHQTVKYVNVVNTQIKLAAVIVHGVVRENTSLTMRVPKVNMIF